jgi:hypothetical protein
MSEFANMWIDSHSSLSLELCAVLEDNSMYVLASDCIAYSITHIVENIVFNIARSFQCTRSMPAAEVNDSTMVLSWCWA